MNTLQGSYALKPRSNKNKILFTVLFALFIVCFACALAFGSSEINLAKGAYALLREDFESYDCKILLYLRLPRALGAVLAGGALAVSGVIIQAVLNNPMASPSVIGVNSGAGLAAAITLAVFPTSLSAMPLFSFLGAFCAMLIIYVISAKTNASRLTITLVGIATGSVLSSGISTVKILFPDSIYDADMFMIGGLSGLTLSKLKASWILITLGLVLAILLSRRIDILCLGQQSAESLGINVKALRFVLLMLASLLSASAVSFCGLIGFVGLVVPHIVRRFTGTRHNILIPASALMGASLVLMCDTFARTAFSPFEIPTGLVLSFIGGLFFIALILFSHLRNG